MPAVLRSLVIGAALATTSPSLVVAAPAPYDDAVDVQTFQLALGPTPFFSVAGHDVVSQGHLSFDALVTVATRLFLVYPPEDQPPATDGTMEPTVVVGSVTAAQLATAYGITDRIQLGVSLPVVLQLRGDGIIRETGAPDPEGLRVSGLGDALVETKVRLLAHGGSGISALAGVTLPTSVGTEGSAFIGDDLPTLRGRVVIQHDLGRFVVAANGGGIVRKARTIYDTTIGSQAIWGAGAAVRITDRFSIVAEIMGRSGAAAPLEAGGGMRLWLRRSLTVALGGGAGILEGVGSPGARFFVTIGTAPDVRDLDRDAIVDARDRCPDAAEDRDRLADDDGCPEDDLDADRRADATDRCPRDAEDLDGFQDEDGCPDLDNDGDKIADLSDKCPSYAEDGLPSSPADGCPARKRDSDGDGVYDDRDTCLDTEEDLDNFADDDGCPDLDNDSDGIADTADRCSSCAEDRDGFEDTDGCPDLDNDRDGIADARDACPLKPETINGTKDDDGCPDAGTAAARLDGDRLTVDRAVALDARNRRKTLDQVAALIRTRPDVTKWFIAVSQPTEASATAFATDVTAQLVQRGVPATVLDVRATVGPAKLAGVVQETGAPSAPPVCPAP